MRKTNFYKNDVNINAITPKGARLNTFQLKFNKKKTLKNKHLAFIPINYYGAYLYFCMFISGFSLRNHSLGIQFLFIGCWVFLHFQHTEFIIYKTVTSNESSYNCTLAITACLVIFVVFRCCALTAYIKLFYKNIVLL